MQDELALSEYVPAGHDVQEEAAPDCRPYLPAAHKVHDEDPVAF